MDGPEPTREEIETFTRIWTTPLQEQEKETTIE